MAWLSMVRPISIMVVLKTVIPAEAGIPAEIAGDS
jgi:hypothetical protein